jgi:hypothetical protein
MIFDCIAEDRKFKPARFYFDLRFKEIYRNTCRNISTIVELHHPGERKIIGKFHESVGSRRDE